MATDHSSDKPVYVCKQPSKCTDDQCQEIVNLSKSGLSNTEIAQRYQISNVLVGRILRQRSEPTPERLEIVSRYKNGETIDELTVSLNRCRRFIMDAIREVGNVSFLNSERPGKQKFTKDQRQSAVADYVSGMTISEVSIKHNMSTTVVRHAVQKYAGKCRKPWNADYKTREEQLAIVATYESGCHLDEVTRIHGVSKSYVTKLVRVHQGKPRGPRTIYKDKNNNYFSEEIPETADRAYIVGLLVTDGSISDNTAALTLSLQARDHEIVKAVRDIIAPSVPVKKKKAKAKKNGKVFPQAVFTVTSKQIKRDLERYGIVPNKTFTATFYKEFPLQLLPHYMRGLIDGDGSWVHTKQNRYWLCLAGTESLISGFAQVIEEKLSIKPSILQKIKRKPTWELRYHSVNDIATIAEFLYKDQGMKIDRKYKRVCALLRDRKLNGRTLTPWMAEVTKNDPAPLNGIANQIVDVLDHSVYHDWNETTLEQLLEEKEQFKSWKTMAASMGIREAQLKNRVNRLKRLARGIKC